MPEPPSAPTAVIFSGGVGHDFAATSARLAALLDEDGWRTVVTETEADLVERLPTTHLLVFNTLRWTMRVPARHAEGAARHGFSPSTELRDGVVGHLQRGRGVLAMHTASICFDDWPQWADVLGAAWDWDRSFHEPVGLASVRVCDRGYGRECDREGPLVHDLPDFEIDDEVYSELRLVPDIAPLVTARSGGRDQALAWAREYDGGRVAHDALGHHAVSFDPPAHRELVRRLARWAGGRDLPR